jgi:propanediol dehydratase small subunit
MAALTVRASRARSHVGFAQVRRDAAEACRAVYRHLGLADFTDGHVKRAVDAAGSKDLGETDTLAVMGAAHAIRERGLTVVDIVAALDETGYEAEAERIMAMTRARLAGDYLNGGPAMTGRDKITALSGRPVDELTLDAIRDGDITLPDLRIHPAALERQASVADKHGNPQLAENLRRAAELSALPDDEVLAIYEALRPGRSTPAELSALAESLADRGLPRCAALLAEAAAVYARRGLSA